MMNNQDADIDNEGEYNSATQNYTKIFYNMFIVISKMYLLYIIILSTEFENESIKKSDGNRFSKISGHMRVSIGSRQTFHRTTLKMSPI
jgi:hypothetical protein